METKRPVQQSGQEIHFDPEEFIVSKTDLRGVITYANDVFMRVSGYSEGELIGQPHNIIRHPEMPGCVFKLAWDTLKSGREIFAYVVNMARNGGHYWVFAHLTPSFDAAGGCIGYHSNRRAPAADAIPKVRKLYALLRAEEARHVERVKGVAAGHALLTRMLAEQGVSYDEFVWSLSETTRMEAAL
ncbi:MAG TPA: chemotaxis protein [Verrucomicrobiales bacterium]|nr:chemotaxis protein [Verrucomicrobiales bacterium]